IILLKSSLFLPTGLGEYTIKVTLVEAFMRIKSVLRFNNMMLSEGICLFLLLFSFFPIGCVHMCFCRHEVATWQGIEAEAQDWTGEDSEDASGGGSNHKKTIYIACATSFYNTIWHHGSSTQIKHDGHHMHYTKFNLNLYDMIIK
ncbi:hypothetical protein ACJX0J_016678, partial [Zea mays]